MTTHIITKDKILIAGPMRYNEACAYVVKNHLIKRLPSKDINIFVRGVDIIESFEEIMCYSGCEHEREYGESRGECGLRHGEKCPEDFRNDSGEETEEVED